MGVKEYLYPHPNFRVVIDGEDVSGLFRSRNHRIDVVDAAGVKSDRVSLSLTDTSVLPFDEPDPGAEVEVALGYDIALKSMGEYVVDRFGFQLLPSLVTIEAKAAPLVESSGGKTALTDQKMRSWEAGTRLGDLVEKIAAGHGLRAAVSSALADIALPHIDQLDESDMNLLSRLGIEFDAIFKPSGGALVFAGRGESLAMSGEPMPIVTLGPSDLTALRYDRSLRPQAARVVASTWDAPAAKPVEVAWDKGAARPVDIGSNQTKAPTGPTRRIKGRYPDRASAERAAKADLRRRARAERSISIELPGNTDLVAEGKVRLVGVRPYLDGEWLITRAAHSIGPDGYRCRVDLEPVE